MKLLLTGHNYKYAVEQIMLSLFPDERPEYPDTGRGEDLSVLGSSEKSAGISLIKGELFTTAFCVLCLNGNRFSGRAAVNNLLLTDKTTADRLLQRAIKLSFYRAALRSGIKPPPWGALTGVRPGKLMIVMLNDEASESRVLKKFCDEYYVSGEKARLCLETAKVSRAAVKMLSPKDICLYVGIPFCPSRCSYCSFVSASTEKTAELIPPFLDCLFKELAATAKIVGAAGRRIRSIYMGGGTPTTLTAVQMDTLLANIGDIFDLSAACDKTVEAGRPDTITGEKLEVLKKHGFFRISINPQSLEDNVLKTIGRNHSPEEIYKAFELCREIGGFTINMDLIAGLPGDNISGFRRTADKIIGLYPENITLHTLSLKKGSSIFSDRRELPSSDAAEKMLCYADGAFRRAGYNPYYLYRQKYMSGGLENVGWTQKGFENLYNICIMDELCDIISVGGGASTKLLIRGGKITRMFNPKFPGEYIRSIERIISDKQKIGEFYSGV